MASAKRRRTAEIDANPNGIVRVLVGERTFKLQRDDWTLIEGSVLATAIEALDDGDESTVDVFEDEDPEDFNFVVKYLRGRGAFFAIPDGDEALASCKRLTDKLGLSQLHAELQLESCRRRLERSVTFITRELGRCETQFAAFHREMEVQRSANHDTKSLAVDISSEESDEFVEELDDRLRYELEEGWKPLSVFPLLVEPGEDGGSTTHPPGSTTSVGVLLGQPSEARTIPNSRLDRVAPVSILCWVVARCYYHVRLQHTRQLLRMLPRRIRKRSTMVACDDIHVKSLGGHVEMGMDELHGHIATEEMYPSGQLEASHQNFEGSENVAIMRFSHEIDLVKINDAVIARFDDAAKKPRPAPAAESVEAKSRRIVARAKHAACVLGLGQKRELERILTDAVGESPESPLALDDI